MFVRIVKMTFRPESTEVFINFFEEYKLQIRNVAGCQYLQVLQDKNQPNIIFSYSHWITEAHLDDYRKSELFKKIWPRTKELFLQAPEAWTTNILHDFS